MSCMTTIGGYRVVRTLGTGVHAVVLLGHPLAGGAQVALKVPHGDDRERAFRELDALDAAADPTVVRLLDACVDERGLPVGVLELLPSATLAELLSRGGAPGKAAVVGLLSTLAEALDRLHGRGVVHGALNASNVLVRQDGTPVLVGFGRASARGDRPTLAARDDDAGMREDCAAFARLAVDLLEASGMLRAASVVGARTLLSSELTALGARLQTETAPEPWRQRDTVILPVPAAVRAPRATASTVIPRRGRRRADKRPVILRGSDHARRAIGTAVVSVRAIRPRFWVAGGAALVALLGALVLVPGPATDAVTPGPQPTVDAENGSRADQEAESEEPSTLDPSPSTSAPATSAPSTSSTEQSDNETELVESVRALLEHRRSCLAERSLLCLAEVSAADSAARRDDEALVSQLRSDEVVRDPLAGANGDVRVVDRYGGAALLEIDRGDTAAPVLVVKTGAGWRIRAYPGS